MRKIIAVLLAFVLTLGIFNVNAFGYNDIDDADHRDAVILLSGLGIVKGYEDGSFRPEEIATRAEFSVMLARLLNMGAIVSGDGKPYFTDVGGDSFAKGAISYCVEAGIMSGYGNGIFKPDKPVTYDEAVKTLISLLGYGFYAENQGEYPFGYRIQAKQMGLTSGVELRNGDAISRAEICALMYNALTIPVLEVTGVGESYTLTEDPSETILKKYFKMTLEKGIINSDGITKIEHVSDADENSVVFNNITLRKNGVYNEDFLGKSVEVIYTLEDNEKPNHLISIVENSKLTKEFTLSAEDIISVSAQKAIYESGDKEEWIYISPTRKVVYNGVFDFTYDLSATAGKGNTVLTFIDNNGDNKYDVIKVDEAVNYIIMDTVGDKLILRDITDGSKTLDLEQIEITEIYDEKGEHISKEELSRKNVNIASVFANGSYYAKIKITNESYTGTITYIENDSDGMKIVLGNDIELKLNTNCKTENGFSVKTGDNVAVYTDINKSVCYIKLAGSSGYKIGYLMAVKPSSSFEGKLLFKIFSRNNKIEGLECADKLKVNDNMLDSVKYETNILNTLYKDTQKGYSQFVVYMTNDEGKLTEIHQYSESAGDTKNKLYRFSPNINGRFSTGTYSFGGVANTDNSTWLIRVPAGDAATATEEDFSIFRTNQIISDSYPIEFYTTSLEKHVADVVCFTGDKLPMTITYDDYLCILERRAQIVDSEGNQKIKLKYYSNGMEYEKLVGDSASSATISQINSMDPGEVFSFAEDNSGEIMAVERYYNMNDGWVASLLDGKPQTNTYGATRRIAAYYVSHISGGYARCSFEPVIANSYDAQLLESIILPGSNVFTLVRKSASGAVQITKGSDKDINILDTVVTRTRGGSDREVIIIKK